MKKFRIKSYADGGFFFDVEMKRWYGWILIKRFKADGHSVKEVTYASDLAEELLEKLEEEI